MVVPIKFNIYTHNVYYTGVYVLICHTIYCVVIQAHTEAVSMAKQLLQMTPVLTERAERGHSLKHDQELDGYLDHSILFTDISTNEDNRVGSVEVVAYKPLHCVVGNVYMYHLHRVDILINIMGQRCRAQQ